MEETVSSLHHVEFCVTNESAILDLLINGFGFRKTCFRSTTRCTQWVLEGDKAIFIVTKRGQNNNSNHELEYESINDTVCLNGDPLMNNLSNNNSSRFDEREKDVYPTLLCCNRPGRCHTDCAFNIAIEVSDVDAITNRIKSRGGNIIEAPQTLSDTNGKIRLSVVSSICPNVVHTLLDKKEYTGNFLPGFKPVANNCEVMQTDSETLHSQPVVLHTLDQAAKNNFIKFIDHLAIVCEIGESQNIIKWYEECFNMKRFFTNKEETEAEGFVLRETIGLRLKALQYWKCAESGVAPPRNANHPNTLRIVIGEPLPEVASSHVQTFLKENLGPGVQHIGLHCTSILNDVERMKHAVQFRKAPPTYYEDRDKINEIKEVGLEDKLQEFQRTGILLDSEADYVSSLDTTQKRYLMQIFTCPIFERDTFFFEVIQRCGATGFGSGNILALARSIVRYQEEQKLLAKASIISSEIGTAMK